MITSVEIKWEWRVSNGRLDDRLRFEQVLAFRKVDEVKDENIRGYNTAL